MQENKKIQVYDNQPIRTAWSEEGNETVTNCHGLRMKAADGKRRMGE